MGQLLLAMGAVLATWLVEALVVAGLGLALRRVLGLRAVGADACLLSFWVGYTAVIGLLQILHLALPLTWHALLAVWAIGALGLAWCGRDVLSWLRGALARRRGAAVAVALAGLWLANQAIGPGDAHDSGVYHYQVIRWINEHAIVPGLGNLSVTYGLNTGSQLRAAMLEAGPWQGRAEHVANGLLLWVLAAQALVSMARLLRGQGSSRLNAYGAALLVPAVMLMFSKEISSPKTDLPVNVVLYVVGWRLLVLLEQADGTPRDRIWRIASLAGLCALAPCLKASAAFFAFGAWLVAAAAWLRRTWQERQTRDWGVIWSLAIPVALVVPWLVRNVVTGGYPLYPSPVLEAPVEWRVPPGPIHAFELDVRVHPQGRQPLWLAEHVADSPLKWYAPLMQPPFGEWEEIQGWAWLRPWFFSLPLSSFAEVVLPVVVAAGAWLAVLGRRWRAGARAPRPGPAAWLLLPCLAGLLFWFLLMPGPRFAYGITWVLAAASLALALDVWCPQASRRGAVTVVALMALLTVPVVIYRAGVMVVLREADPLTCIPFRGPGPDHGFHPRPRVETRTVTTRWGLEVRVPVQTAKCWDAPLPCLGWMPDPNLRLRREGDLGAGFVVDPWGGLSQ